MSEHTTDAERPRPEEETFRGVRVEIKLLLIVIVLVGIGVAGYFIFRNLWIRYVFAHLGGLGVMVPFGFWAGAVARKKGYSFWPAFFMGFLLPVILGILTTILFHLSGGRGCGGIVSIAVALIVIIVYYMVKKK